MAQNLNCLDERLTSLEERLNERLEETRSVWEAVEVQIQRLGEKLDAILLDFYELRGELKIHGRRIGELERRVLS
jgi:predicted  nucleic acid-binding Zn-ribbon protein